MKSQSLRYILGCWFFLLSSTLFAQNPWPEVIPANTEFSLLTASPGDDVHNIFGHSALRMRNDSLKLDIVFNWGTFNYKTPNFVPKFILGKLPYRLSVSRYSRFKKSYVRQDRSLTEIVFDLDESQKQKLNDLLIENYKEENRTYRYDFFYDNCSTRIRDLIEASYGNELKLSVEKDPPTYLHLLQDFLRKDSWLRLGINLILGRKAYENAGAREAMFLPTYLETNLKKANVNGVSVIKSKSTIHKGVDSRKATLIPPFIPFSILLLIGIVACFKSPNKEGHMFLLDKLFFSFIGLAGWLFIFMWLGTKHIATHQNWHIFWAIPLYLPLVWILKGKKLHYFMFMSFMLIVPFLLQDFLIDQRYTSELSPTILIIIGLTVVRILYNMKATKPA